MNESFISILYNKESTVLEPGNAVIEISSKIASFNREDC